VKKELTGRRVKVLVYDRTVWRSLALARPGGINDPRDTGTGFGGFQWRRRMLSNCNVRLSQAPDWCDVAERAAKESDPKKLIQLVRALCDRLQEAERMKKKGSQPSPAPESIATRSKPTAV
jgi:hypothetical protein